MVKIILVVEDHSAVREALTCWFRVAFSECRVIEAVTGEEAVLLARREHPHLVVMDISLPGMNGIETTKQIKAVVPTTHIVILTSQDAEVYRTDAMAAGTCAFVTQRSMRTKLIPVLTALLNVD